MELFSSTRLTTGSAKQPNNCGLVVIGGDSCSEGREFKSRHRILDGHFFTYIFVVKICNVCFERCK